MNSQNNFNSTTSSQTQKPRKIINSRSSTAFNMSSLKKLNQDLLSKMERQKVQQELESVKKDTKSVLDDIPMMTFDEDPHARGWKSIYLGLYSPFSNKYTAFMKHAIEKAKENSNSPNKRHDQSQNNGTYSNSEAIPSFVQMMQLSQKSGKKRQGSIIGNSSMNGDMASNKTDNPPSRNQQESQELTSHQWQEQQEIQCIIMFESLSKHKRDIIESQIRNGNQNFMAQKYLQLVQQKKLKRTLQDVFRVKAQNITNSKNMLRKDLFNHTSYSQSKRKSSTRLDNFNLMTPTAECENNSDLLSQKSQQNNLENKHKRALSLSEFKFIDMRWQQSQVGQPPSDITKRFRSISAQARIDSKIINKNFQTSRFQHSRFANYKSEQDNLQRKDIIRRKSCECQLCGGEAKRIPIAAIFQEDELESENEEEKEAFSTGITLKFPVATQNLKARGNLFKNLIGIITKGSPSNRQQQLKNSKTQANLLSDGFASANTLRPNGDKNLDYFDKEKILRKYKGTKQFGGLSPIFDIERVVKKKMGLNKSKLHNQQTQISPSKIGIISPNIQRYKKLITVDSNNSNFIASPQSSSESQSPDSTKKAAQVRKSNDKFEGFLNLKTMQLPNQKDKLNFFSIRNSGQDTIQELEQQEQSVKDVQDDSLRKSQLINDQDKSRNNQSHNSLMINNKLNTNSSTIQLNNTNHLSKNKHASSLLYTTQNKFLERVSSFQVEMKYNMMKKEEQLTKQIQKQQHQSTLLLNSQSQLSLPQIQSPQQLPSQKQNKSQKVSHINNKSKQIQVNNIEKNYNINVQKDQRDHLAYEKIYYQRLSKMIK